MESLKSFHNLLLCSISYSLLPLVMNAIKHLFQDYLEKNKVTVGMKATLIIRPIFITLP